MCTDTAVFSPENENSKPLRSSIDRGNAIAFASPSRARRSITGPPGYPSPSSFATLSKASPAASSRVHPSTW
jgi:hypothetical protein